MWRRRIIAIGSPPHLRLIKGKYVQEIIYNSAVQSNGKRS